MIILLAVILSLTLSLANRAHGSTERREWTPAGATDSLRNDSPNSTIGLSLGFAMADFTGDTHPDLASVELNGFDSASAQYVIEVRLTEGGGQLLRVRAPFGGLLVTARDLTGDGNLDLVIRAARSRALVAIFLNDGHGHFSATEPSAFTKVLRETTSSQEFSAKHFYFSATLVSLKSYAISWQGGASLSSQVRDGCLFSANRDVTPHPFVPFGLDRAPPTVA